MNKESPTILEEGLSAQLSTEALSFAASQPNSSKFLHDLIRTLSHGFVNAQDLLGGKSVRRCHRRRHGDGDGDGDGRCHRERRGEGESEIRT